MSDNITKSKVLVIEDKRPMVKALTIKLEREGFEVKTAEDGEAGKKLLQSEQFDIILLDLVLPKADGFAVLAEMKTLNLKTPVIVLSNLSQEEDERRAKELGATEYFVKSDITINEVVKHINKILADK